MIISLAPMTLALFAAASTVGASDLARVRTGPGSPPPNVCVAPRARDCPHPPPAARKQQQPPPPAAEKSAPENPEAGKKVGAGEQVRKYVDERAPRIADWLFDSPTPTPTQGPGLDGEPLRNRGLRSLPPGSGTPRTSNDLTVLDDLGFVIAGAEPRMVYVVSILAASVGSPTDIRPNDVILALNGHSIDTPQTFRSRYSRLRSGQPVELRLRRGEQRLTVAFYKPVRSQLPGRGAATNAEPPGPILPD